MHPGFQSKAPQLLRQFKITSVNTPATIPQNADPMENNVSPDAARQAIIDNIKAPDDPAVAPTPEVVALTDAILPAPTIGVVTGALGPRWYARARPDASTDASVAVRQLTEFAHRCVRDV